MEPKNETIKAARRPVKYLNWRREREESEN